jgi:hypothetical protein
MPACPEIDARGVVFHYNLSAPFKPGIFWGLEHHRTSYLRTLSIPDERVEFFLSTASCAGRSGGEEERRRKSWEDGKKKEGAERGEEREEKKGADGAGQEERPGTKKRDSTGNFAREFYLCGSMGRSSWYPVRPQRFFTSRHASGLFY